MKETILVEKDIWSSISVSLYNEFHLFSFERRKMGICSVYL